MSESAPVTEPKQPEESAPSNVSPILGLMRMSRGALLGRIHATQHARMKQLLFRRGVRGYVLFGPPNLDVHRMCAAMPWGPDCEIKDPNQARARAVGRNQIILKPLAYSDEAFERKPIGPRRVEVESPHGPMGETA